MHLLSSSLPPSRGIAIPRASGEHGKAFSHAFACELMRGMLLSLMPRGRSTIGRDGGLLGTLFRGMCCSPTLAAPKTLGILSLRSRKRAAWKVGHHLASPLGFPAGPLAPLGSLARNFQMPFCVAVFLAVTAYVGCILKEEIESTTRSLCTSLQPATRF
jgi:hypothetical protein